MTTIALNRKAVDTLQVTLTLLVLTIGVTVVTVELL